MFKVKRAFGCYGPSYGRKTVAALPWKRWQIVVDLNSEQKTETIAIIITQ